MSLKDIKARQGRRENRSEKGIRGISEGDLFTFLNLKWNLFEAVKIIEHSPREPQNFNVKDWSQFIGERPDQTKTTINIGIVYINWDYVTTLTEEDIKEPGIAATFRFPPGDTKLRGLLIDGWHRLAKSFELGKEFFPVYVLAEEENNRVMTIL